jgi:hypothetical protein
MTAQATRTTVAFRASFVSWSLNTYQRADGWNRRAALYGC